MMVFPSVRHHQKERLLTANRLQVYVLARALYTGKKYHCTGISERIFPTRRNNSKSI